MPNPQLWGVVVLVVLLAALLAVANENPPSPTNPAAKAAGVLANLASEHDDTCVDIAEAGAVGPLVALLGSESEDGKVHAARTLSAGRPLHRGAGVGGGG